MTGLHSLPRLPARVRDGLRPALTAIRRGITPATRQQAARQLVSALRAGRVTPSQAVDAMREGDAAVAALLQPHGVVLPRPCCTTSTLRGRPTHRHLRPETLEVLARLGRFLVEEGDMPAATWIRRARGRADPPGLVRDVMQAWNARCRRVVARIQPGAATRCSPRYAVHVVPLLDAMACLTERNETPLDMIEDALPSGVVCELVDVPITYCPAHPVRDPAFFQALTGAWMALAQTVTVPLVEPFDPTLMMVGGGMVEELVDAVTRATWEDDQPNWDAQDRAYLEEMLGEVPDAARCRQLRDWLTAAQAPPMHPDTPTFAAWQATAPPGPRRTVERLLARTQTLQALTADLPRPTTHRYGGEGHLSATLVPQDTGCDEMLEGCLESTWADGPSAIWQGAPAAAHNLEQLVGLADRVMLEAATATVCLYDLHDGRDDHARTHEPAGLL